MMAKCNYLNPPTFLHLLNENDWDLLCHWIGIYWRLRIKQHNAFPQQFLIEEYRHEVNCAVLQ